jgi:hypothetical protein
MDLEVTFGLARVLIVSDARVKSKTGKPSSPGYSSLLFSAAVFIASAVVIVVMLGGEGAGLEELLPRFLVFLPSFMAFSNILYGYMSEFGQAESTASVDMVNWLPIGATEYVAASSLANLYSSLPLAAIMYGAALGLAYVMRDPGLWLVSFAMGVVGAALGTFFMESVRAFMNRGGRRRVGAGVGNFVRQLGRLLLFVVFSMMFNIVYLLRILQWFSVTLEQVWFIPLLWPSLALKAYISWEPAALALYVASSAAFTAAVFGVAVSLKARYWVPEAPSHASGAAPGGSARSPLRGGGRIWVFVQKDVRSLIRRREMMRVLAVPMMMIVMAILNAGPAFLSGDMGVEEGVGFVTQMGVAAAFFAFYLGLVSFGQEGSNFGGLVASPVSSTFLVKAKWVFAAFVSAPTALVSLAAYWFVSSPGASEMVVVSTLVFAVLMEVGILGVLLGIMFVDFTEVPRARFVSGAGILVGFVLLVICVAATIAPYGLSMAWGRASVGAGVAGSLLVAAIFTAASYRLAVSSTKALMEDDY